MEFNFDCTLYPYGESKEFGIVGIDTKAQYGYWEYKSGAEGGGLWFDNGALVDYDGAFELPKKVLVALQKAGYNLEEIAV